MTNGPVVSVVVPTYNRIDRLPRVLAALEAQTCTPELFEVVVVSDGSTDGTDEYLARSSWQSSVTVAQQANGGPAAARNHGLELARGEIVLFVDDDVVADAGLVAEHLASHEAAAGDAVVIGPMLTPPDHQMKPWVAWEQAMLYKQYAAMDGGLYPATFRQFYTGNASAPRARLLEAGGFDTRFRRAEDVELSYRLHQAGLEFVWNRRAAGYHYADRSFEAWLRTARDYGVAEVVFGCGEGQDPRLERVRAEFTGRNPLVRWLARGSVASPWLGPLAERMLRWVAAAGAAVHEETTSRLALSGIFNLAYYGGLADALGGPEEFHRVMVEGEAPRASRILAT